MPLGGTTPLAGAAPLGGAGGATTPQQLPSPDALFTGIEIAELDRVSTVQEVMWSQNVASDSAHIAFMFEDDEWHESPARAGEVGAHREVVLGAPEGAALSIKIVATFGTQIVESPIFNLTNGVAPSRMPRAEVEAFEPSLASQHRWMLGAVSEGGNGSYADTHWMYIMDRRGRVVWYQAALAGNGSLDSGYAPRVSPDGTHITYDQLTRFDDGYIKFATLDFVYEREIHVPAIGDGHAIASDGAVIYEDGTRVWEVAANDEDASDRREVYACSAPSVNQDQGALTQVGQRDTCYANALNYDPASDSIMLSYPYQDSAVQLSRSGEVLRVFGELGDYAIEPGYEFDFNHWAHITSAGTLIVSSHRVGTEIHLFNEFEIDDDAKELRLIWSYGDGVDTDYAAERGMAARVDDSTNRIANYGPTGVIVEITEAGEIAWRVNFSDNVLSNRSLQGTPLPAMTRGNLIHNNVLINDLYALNRGPSQP
jgi:hypothetical protein